MYSHTAGAEKLVLGTASLGSVWGAVTPDDAIQTIHLALDSGIRWIDTSPAYGDAEQLVGRAVRQWRGPAVQLSSKAGVLKAADPAGGGYDFSPSGLWRSVESTLQTLRVDVLDILFLHDPYGVDPATAGRTIEVFLDIKERGYCRMLGVGGNYPSWFESWITSDIFSVFMGYSRHNAVTAEALTQEYRTLSSRGTEIWQGSPLLMGLLGRRLAEFREKTPEFIAPAHLARATRLERRCANEGLLLADCALRYLLGDWGHSKICLGAASPQELEESLTAARRGPLPADLIAFIKDLQQDHDLH